MVHCNHLIHRQVFRDRQFRPDGEGLAVQRGCAHARGCGPRGRRDKREGKSGRPVLGKHKRGWGHIPVVFPA